jgi:hypothetical protein
LYLQYIALKDPLVYTIVARTYTLFLFTTPFFIYSATLSGVYVLSFGRRRKQKTNRLASYPDPSSREDLFLVVGEVHHPTKIVRGSSPQWLAIPEKGLFTGIGIFGAIGTGKTSCCMRPFAEQLIAYKASEPAKRIGGLVLEVKGDFCHQIREIARQHGREDDYVEVALDSEYRYNPLHNDLDPSALAYSVATTGNSLIVGGDASPQSKGNFQPRLDEPSPRQDTSEATATSIPAIFSLPTQKLTNCEAAPLPNDAFVAGQDVPVDRWIFGQHNKILPVKASSCFMSSVNVFVKALSNVGSATTASNRSRSPTLPFAGN